MSEALIARIHALHARDREQAGIVTALDELPFSYELIGTDWMTQVLCRDVPGARVTAIRLAEADDGTAQRRRIFVAYNEAGQAAGLPRSVFSKASHSVLHRINMGLSGAASSEIQFYRNIRPLLSIECPQSFFANMDGESFNSILILNDIADEVEFCDDRTVIARGQIAEQLALLAHCHAAPARDRRITPATSGLGTWPDFFEAVVGYGHEDASNEGFLAAEDVIPPSLFRRFEECWPATRWANELHRRLPATLIHGDCHLKQWYVRRDRGTMGIADWQCASWGHWSRDLAYVIATSLDIDDRRAWERDLIAEYIDMLRSGGLEPPGFDEVFRLYRINMAGILTWWTCTLRPNENVPELQPERTTLKFIERIAHAMDDLDSIDACGAGSGY